MFQISLEESLRRNGDAGAAEEVARLRCDAEAYHRIMGLLHNMQMAHGTCQPRERRACTHCNAADDIQALVASYAGPKIKPV